METLKQHLDVLRCPHCSGHFTLADAHLSCENCKQHYLSDAKIINFSPEIAEHSGLSYGQKLMEDSDSVLRYESVQRKLYVRLMGKAFWGRSSLRYEANYLKKQISLVPAGKILDLACGSGIATRLLNKQFDAERIIGLDISYAMLHQAKLHLPEILFLRGEAGRLPMSTDSLAAVTCWDALQAIPNPKNAIQEIGRVLKPGGHFVCFTFKKSQGPYRWVQNRLAQKVGSFIFDVNELTAWMNEMNLSIKNISGPGHTLFLHAIKN